MRKIATIAIMFVIIAVMTPVVAQACGGGGGPIVAPETRLAVGMHGTTNFIESEEYLRVREDAGLSGKNLAKLHNGTAFVVVDGPVSMDGYLWWKVVTEDQTTTGWVAEGAFDQYYIKPV